MLAISENKFAQEKERETERRTKERKGKEKHVQLH